MGPDETADQINSNDDHKTKWKEMSNLESLLRVMLSLDFLAPMLREAQNFELHKCRWPDLFQSAARRKKNQGKKKFGQKVYSQWPAPSTTPREKKA
mgnify:CR=1 FL=1